MQLRILLMVVLVFSCLTISAAKPIIIEFAFTKKPPVAAVIYVDEAKPADKKGVIDQLQKQFTKHIVATDNSGSLVFKNSDEVDHNIFAQDSEAGVRFDVGLMPSGSEKQIDVNWNADSLVRIGCKIHPRMRAYIANFNSDLYQVIEFDRKQKNSRYEFSKAPADKTKFHLLLPKYDAISFELKPGEEKIFTLIRSNKERGHVTISRR